MATKPSETSMTPKQLRFHLPKTRGEEQGKKDGDIVLHPSDNIDNDYDDDETQVAVEEEGQNDDDDDDDIEMPHEGEDEVQESEMFAVISRPSISGQKVNPLRYVSCIRFPTCG